MKNLDTGEEMDLVEAEDKLPQSINPLSLHIMRLTSEYVRWKPNYKVFSIFDFDSKKKSSIKIEFFLKERESKTISHRRSDYRIEQFTGKKSKIFYNLLNTIIVFSNIAFNGRNHRYT